MFTTPFMPAVSSRVYALSRYVKQSACPLWWATVNPRRRAIVALIKLAVHHVANCNIRHLHWRFLDILSGKRIARGVDAADIDVWGMAGLVVVKAAFRNRTRKNVAFVHLLHETYLLQQELLLMPRVYPKRRNVSSMK